MCVGRVLDDDMGALLHDQQRAIARQREELERAEIELRDLETTIAAAGGRRQTRMRPISVLFICNGNSARSQIAEALLGRLGGDAVAAHSAGTAPKALHPLAVTGACRGRHRLELAAGEVGRRALRPSLRLRHHPVEQRA